MVSEEISERVRHKPFETAGEPARGGLLNLLVSPAKRVRSLAGPAHFRPDTTLVTADEPSFILRPRKLVVAGPRAQAHQDEAHESEDDRGVPASVPAPPRAIAYPEDYCPQRKRRQDCIHDARAAIETIIFIFGHKSPSNNCSWQSKAITKGRRWAPCIIHDDPNPTKVEV